MSDGVQLSVYGLINDIDFQRARCCAEDLHHRIPGVFTKVVVEGFLEFEWCLYIEDKKKELGGECWHFDEKAIVFQKDQLNPNAQQQLLGGPNDFLIWAEDNFNFEEFRPVPLYQTLTEEAYKNYLNSRNSEYVYLDVKIGNEDEGRLLIELFSGKVPRTCENFKMLCTGEKDPPEDSDCKLSYENSIFHRIVRDGWIQGGDIYLGRGNGGESIYGSVFEDENFSVSHTRRGIVGMSNKGRHTNGSQFYITLQPTKWMDTKYVAFGQVIEGTEILKKMEEQETMNERPMKEIKIVKSGVITFEF